MASFISQLLHPDGTHYSENASPPFAGCGLPSHWMSKTTRSLDESHSCDVLGSPLQLLRHFRYTNNQISHRFAPHAQAALYPPNLVRGQPPTSSSSGSYIKMATETPSVSSLSGCSGFLLSHCRQPVGCHIIPRRTSAKASASNTF